jgi:hypothetical protein
VQEGCVAGGLRAEAVSHPNGLCKLLVRLFSWKSGSINNIIDSSGVDQIYYNFYRFSILANRKTIGGTKFRKFRLQRRGTWSESA